MIPLARLLAFALTAALIIAIPGPGVLFVIGRALSNGRRVAMFSAVGQEAGGFVLVVAVALGIGSVMERSVLLFTVVKLIGAVYLVILGIHAIARRHAYATSGRSPDTRGARAVQILLLGAVFVVIALVFDATWSLLAGGARTCSPARPGGWRGSTVRAAAR
ncbi:MAG TPA: LysE family transporter [Actinocatenispora sp.]